ncbi:MAG: HTTM domain-containing protein [Bdellovibrionales bacterium]|nr:HTTM domain-containing protein [Bdellovibrionales bacterium]
MSGQTLINDTALKKIFSADIRSLALMRVAIGVLVLYDLFDRLRDLTAHYTDLGILPRSTYFKLFSDPWWISFHLAGGAWGFELILFSIHIACAIAFLFGYRTKLSTFLTWIFYVSLQWRNIYIGQGGDTLLRMILLWSIFMPMGACFSIDRIRNPLSNKLPTNVLTIGTIAYYVQIILMYLCTATLKVGKEWFQENSAVAYALQIDQFARPIGVWLRQAPAEVLEFLTQTTMIWEYFAPILLLCPFFFGPLRTFIVFGFLALHAGFIATLAVGIFPFIAAVAMFGMLPNWFWDTLAKKIICRREDGVDLLLTRTWPIESPLKKIGVFTKLLSVKVPISIQNSIAQRLCAFLLLILTILYNIETLTLAPFIPNQIRWITVFAHIDQSWLMFAPSPMKFDGWEILEGTLEDGERIDLMRDLTKLENKIPVNWEKPDKIYSLYFRQRWRQYFVLTRSAGRVGHRVALAEYICRTWNAKHSNGDRLLHIDWHYMLEETKFPLELMKIEPTLLLDHDCETTQKTTPVIVHEEARPQNVSPNLKSGTQK